MAGTPGRIGGRRATRRDLGGTETWIHGMTGPALAGNGQHPKLIGLEASTPVGARPLRHTSPRTKGDRPPICYEGDLGLLRPPKGFIRPHRDVGRSRNINTERGMASAAPTQGAGIPQSGSIAGRQTDTVEP